MPQAEVGKDSENRICRMEECMAEILEMHLLGPMIVDNENLKMFVMAVSLVFKPFQPQSGNSREDMSIRTTRTIETLQILGASFYGS